MHEECRNLGWCVHKPCFETLPNLNVQYTTDLDSTSRLKSVTQERDLDEFLNTAQLAETDFTAGDCSNDYPI